ncbi:deoxyribose-phosphate aldolase [Idiomarina seosinensis]|uniref:deoxyribose-phosphate aldolase n=1 Tax=Idiomarina seosinensis TaxID=281739 RepID=UPI00384B2C3E
MREQAEQILSLVDLTTLNNNDSGADISQLCEKASIGKNTVAALCVFPEWVFKTQQELAKRDLQIPVATVTNFPEGHADVARAVAETERALAVGADEIDVVLPYQNLLQEDEKKPAELVKQVKQVCEGRAKLKVIIESGQLMHSDLIRRASEIAITEGADFIKTSTGKVKVNATLQAAEVMLQTIKESGSSCGFKAAGGIKTLDQAQQYVAIATRLLGADWVKASHFRIGASSLVDDLKQQLSE